MTDKQFNEITVLQDTCEKFDEITLKLNWEMLRNRKNDVNEDFFHYEEDQLVGFLATYYFGEKVEICGMVHPNFRRKGIFSSLLNEALNSLSSVKTILLNAPKASASAKEFIRHQKNCSYSFSEYQMVWKNQEVKEYTPIVKFKKAELVDFAFISNLDVVCFGFENSDAQKYNQRILNEPNRHIYIIEVNNEKIGKMSLLRENNESWIFGFAILPEYQGKGYGKNALLQIIQKEHEIGNEIHLEVALENSNAKKLYIDCGFRQYNTQDYYKMNK
ncbi:GNAT family N-acetyltransferase [Bacillus sp. AFS055030]|uniref:GNAT family N-acetyltransferase n=1 Tax=Bacillus sp. AFS055030 TaxID=2033507 RepID=UPI000BFD9AA5|nr:GNAT family N-acetyltransferase [Bacillus sp. AFS055030]PGL68888.1 GNAT family N-acetyltransferase [Bacillus sp. AFS055030]